MHCRRELYWHDGACAATSEKARQLAQHAAYVRGAEERRKKQYESEVAANKAARAAYNTTPEGKKKLAKQAAEKRKRRVQTLLCVAGAGLVWTGLAYVDSGSSLSLGGYFIGPGVVLIVAAILLARIKVG
jgi:hypothetical protein